MKPSSAYGVVNKLVYEHNVELASDYEVPVRTMI